MKWIQNYSFLNCKSLRTIDLNVANGQLGEAAFAHCESLETVTLCADLKTLPSKAFIYCYSLSDIHTAGATGETANVADLSQITSFGSNAFQHCTGLKKVTLSTDSSFTALSNYLFDGCSALEEVTLPNQLTYLGTYTFRNSGLKKVRMPDGVSVLGSSATNLYPSLTTKVGVFDGCTKLTNLDLNNVIRIGGLSFRNCPLTEVADTLDLSKVEEFCTGAFAGTGLKQVNLSGVLLKSTGTSAKTPPMGFGNGSSNRTTLLTNSDGEGVFENCTQLTKVTFSNQTGTFAFGSGATSKTVKVEFGAQMFKGCTALESVEMPASAVTFADQTFYGCSALKEIKNTDKAITSFGDYAFAGCTSLEAIDFSKATATSIATGMFDGCTKLADVKLNTGKITSIGNYAFRNCVSLVSEVPEGTPDNAKISAFSLSSMKLTKIGTSAFEGCTGLKKVEIAALTKATGKITIGASAFRGCSSLTSVTLSKNVTTINASAFGNCAKLKSIKADGNTNFEVKNGLLYKADGTIICIPAGLEFENNTVTLGDDEKIGAGALDGCVNLKKLVLPESITTIAANYFQDAKYLEEIVISSKTESIGNYAFDGSGLKKITYNGYISDEAETLKTSVFPATLKTIGQQAFQGTQLEKVIIPETLNGVEFNSKGNVSSYSIKAGAFSASALKSVVIEGAETYFAMNSSGKDGVFANCVQLTDVKFMAETAQYGKNLFYGCTALTSVQLPSKATTLGESMFAECTALTSITLPETLTALPGYIFQNCTGLTSVTIPKSVTTLGYSVFRGSGITEIEIPAGIEAIPNWTFMDCANLTKVVFHEGLTSIGVHAFENCTALEKVELPEGLTKLDGFTGCTNLKEITLPGTLESISSDAFNDCTALKSLVIPSSVTSVKFAFKGWTAEQTIYIEKSPSEVYNQWATDSDGGYYWFMYDYSSYESQYFYPCEAKIVWNYSPEATTAGENAK